jgi:hypothetical protein
MKVKVEILKDDVSGLVKGQIKTILISDAEALEKMDLVKILSEQSALEPTEKPKKTTKKK